MGLPNNIDRSHQLLARLNEIKIRTFQSTDTETYVCSSVHSEHASPAHLYPSDDTTPTSGTCDLPTPDSEDSIGLPQRLVQVTEANSQYVARAYLSRAGPSEHAYSAPLGLTFTPHEPPPQPVPIMKDLDSFTDNRSGLGSSLFDSIPAAGFDLDGTPILPITQPTLQQSFPQQNEENLRESIQMWREDVSLQTPGPTAVTGVALPSSWYALAQTPQHKKRPRSAVSSNDEIVVEEESRRTRPKVLQRIRAQSLSSVASTLNSFSWAVPERPPSAVGTG